MIGAWSLEYAPILPSFQHTARVQQLCALVHPRLAVSRPGHLPQFDIFCGAGSGLLVQNVSGLSKRRWLSS